MNVTPLPRSELVRRIGLVVGFLNRSGADVVPLACGRNVDRTYIPAETATPSIEDTIVKCRICGDEAWFGPVILRTPGAALVCFICAGIMSGINAGPTSFVQVDPEASARPRRTG